ncbi:3-isopropylmalate dehydratase small subunit, partial [candidate division KSB1 bacterium]|nr:3-isopropylmalate dehydratase small subunit [Phycisphaerae bacterium]NIR47280.1 3-isopropylmalate dehydratase small subunit [candidate division KSB1 bacterium]NIS22898.1 3-isopropylmalate dehydratase small subunit [candidate division KSB1 bacterium]NIU23404.1 3-isopropylmalate dehydratase small subunit [candidate division KSB1 bacterium]NIV69308.1 3-isopropylmalate dehydratase small subunit [Phycisphaerae bacterium]
ELPQNDINELFALGTGTIISIDLEKQQIVAENSQGEKKEFSFELNPFDHELVISGGWLPYADSKY